MTLTADGFEEIDVDDAGTDVLETGGDDRGDEVDRGDVVTDAADDDGGGQTDGAVERNVSRVVPKDRFNEVNQKAKSLAEQNDLLMQQNKLLMEQLQGRAPAVPDTPPVDDEPDGPTLDEQIDGLEDQIDEARLEGDFEQVRLLRQQVRTLQREQIRQEMRQTVTATQQQEQQATALQRVAGDALAAYPFLDHTNPDVADGDAITAVRVRRAELEGQGMSSVQALQKAVEEKGPKFAKLLGYKVPDVSQAEGRKRNAAAAAAQPPSIGSMGVGERGKGASYDVTNMSEEDFAALPEKEKRRLRGD